MESPAALIIICLLLPTLGGGEDIFDRLVPSIFSRLAAIRKVLLPVDEETLEEALYHAGTYYIPLDSETPSCRNHSNLFFESYLQKEIWALRMIDASSKLPSGVLDGHVMDLGSYDQCLSVQEPGGRFRGQYCVVETKGVLPSDFVDTINPERRFLETLRADFSFAVCVPSSCTARDVQVHMDVALNSINASAIVLPRSCSSAIPQPFSLGDWAGFVVLIAIVLCVVLSTVYDNSCEESVKNGLLSSFSLSRNIPQMVDTSTTNAAITSLNGLRVLAMVWVIMGHGMLHLLAFPNIRLRNISENIDSFSMAPVENTQLAVEIFFLMTGVLVTYGYLRYSHKGKPFNLVHFYLYRYLRLTPVLAVMALLYATIMIRVTDGPLWRRIFTSYQECCQHYWWTSLLYISNYYNPYEICVTQSWYLSSDFQMYVLSPLLLVPLFKKPKLGLALISALFILTTAGGLWNAYHLELKAGGAVTLDRRTERNNTLDYIVTHLRAASFLMGMALGYLLYKIKQGQLILKLSRGTLWAGWLISIFFMVFSIFFVIYFQSDDYVYSPVVDTLYLILHRHILSIGISWVVLVCTLGYGGAVDHFLSWRALIPLARLTYCAYLTHVLVQSVHTISQRVPASCGQLTLWYNLCADFALSYLTGALLYLAVEAPCANIITWTFQGVKKSEEDHQIQIQTQTQLPVFKYTSS